MLDPSSLDVLADRLVGPVTAIELRTLAEDSPDLLRSDDLDGRLALRAWRFRENHEYANRIGAMRHALELARFDGFEDAQRPTWHWLAWLFDPGAAYHRPLPGPPSDDPHPGLSPEQQLLGDLAAALVMARSQEGRRRLLVAHDHLAADLERLFDEPTPDPDRTRAARLFGDMVRDGRRRGWDAACADAPHLFQAETLAPSVERAYLTIEEQLQLVWLSYIEAPAWHRRREIVTRAADLLLAPEHDGLLRELWALAEQAMPTEIVRRARTVLERVRRDGIETAFSGELPSSQVVMASAARRLAVATGAARVSAARTLAHFYDPALWPTMHAQMCGDLAAALTDHDAGIPRAVAIEEASWRAVEAAVDLAAGDPGHDELLRSTHLTLAQAQLARVRGPRDRHGESAIEILHGLIPRSSGRDAAVARCELAGAMLVRVSGVEVENAATARQHAAEALTLATDLGDDAVLARAHVLLGAAVHRILPRGDSVDRTQAVGHLEQALELCDPEGASAAFAHLHLGMVHASSGPRSHTEAMHHLEAALSFYTRESTPARWAELQEALGNALMRGRPEDPEAWAEAHSHYVLALEEYDGAPLLQMRCLGAVATTFFRAEMWRAALDYYDTVLRIADQLTECEQTQDGRLSLVSALRNVHERAAYCMVRLDSPWRALETLEQGRLVGMRRLYGNRLGSLTGDGGDLARLVARHAATAPIVVPLVTSAGSVLFVLTCEDGAARLSVVPVPGLTDDDLRLILDGGPGRTGWLLAYHDWLEAQAVEPGGSDQESAERERWHAFERWSTEIQLALGDLGRLLMEPMAHALQMASVPERATIRIVPSKWLGLLPLHAASCSGGVFADSFTVVALPALRLLDEEDTPEPPAEPLLVALVADHEDLEFAAAEAASVAARFPNHRLLRADARGVDTLANSLDRATHVHIVCHGTYDWARPGQSGLWLSDGLLLSGEQIATLALSGTSLVTLSACETALTDADRAPNEFLGLPGSVLTAGARTIVCSLWAVDDEASERLMSLFYDALGDGPAAALAGAQQKMREEGFDDPYFWAAFALIDCR